MRLRKPATLRARLLACLLLVATVVIIVLDVATVTTLRGSQTRRIDGLLNQVTASHRPQAAELLTAARRRQPPSVLPGLPIDYYIMIVTNDRGIVPLSAQPDMSPTLPTDLPGLARSGDSRTVPGAGGTGSFRLRAVPTEAGILVAAVNLRSVTDAIHELQAILAVATIIAMAVLAAVGRLVFRHGLLPLEVMAAQADRITAGDLTGPVAPQTPDTEVGRLGLALNRMLSRIHASVQEQLAGQERMRRFFADAGHELRTPLTSLRANAELYGQGALTTRAEVDEAIRRIQVSARRMGALVDDMLRLARLDQQPVQRIDTVDLSALLTDGLCEARATDGDRTWVGEIQSGLLVRGDLDMLRRAVDNLLANVRVHTPSGTTGIVTAHRRGDQVEVEIRDDGPGVPRSALPRLFDRFYRADHTGPGSGLGLAIVAEVATGHGGRATATAATPHGLRIHLTLPAATRPAPQRPSPRHHAHDGAASPSPRPREVDDSLRIDDRNRA